MNIGDLVYKKSKKPFQNGKRVGEVIGFTGLYIEAKKSSVPAVVLRDCIGPVSISILKQDEALLTELSIRDSETS